MKKIILCAAVLLLLISTSAVLAQQPKTEGLVTVIYVYGNGNTVTISKAKYEKLVGKWEKNKESLKEYHSSTNPSALGNKVTGEDAYGPIMFFREHKELVEVVMKGEMLDSIKGSSAIQEIALEREGRKNAIIGFSVEKGGMTRIFHDNLTYFMWPNGNITMEKEVENADVAMKDLANLLSRVIKIEKYWAKQDQKK